MGRLSRKLRKIGIASSFSAKRITASREEGKARKAAAAQAPIDAANAASAAQSAEQQAVAAAETEYRGRLRQPGGLASTILNLGGAAGDPNRPEASGLLGIPKPLGEEDSSDPVEILKRKRRAGL